MVSVADNNENINDYDSLSPAKKALQEKIRELNLELNKELARKKETELLRKELQEKLAAKKEKLGSSDVVSNKPENNNNNDGEIEQKARTEPTPKETPRKKEKRPIIIPDLGFDIKSLFAKTEDTLVKIKSPEKEEKIFEVDDDETETSKNVDVDSIRAELEKLKKELKNKEKPSQTTYVSSGGGGGATKLSELDDVDLSDIRDGQALVFRASDNKFVFVDPPQGGGGGGLTQEELDDILNPPALTSFTVSPSSFELGAEATSLRFRYTFNKEGESASINNGIGTLSADDQTFTDLEFDSNTTFRLTVDYQGESYTRNTSISFLNRVYVFVFDEQNPTSEQIRGLTVGTLRTNSRLTNTYDCTGGNYFFIAYPKRFGLYSDVKVNNFAYNDYTITELLIPNSNGYEESYYLYRSNNLLFGSGIVVEWR